MTTKNTGKRDRNQVLIAAFSLLGASLGITTPAGAADTTGLFLKGHDNATSTQQKADTTGTQIKGETTGIWIKDQATSKQHKGDIELQSFTIKHQAPTTGTQIKGETTSTQHKFWKPQSNQIKFDGTTQSNQLKLEGSTQSNQLKH